MGLSSLPAPAEGVLCIILKNTAQSISIFKGILCFIIQIVGILLSSSSSSSTTTSPEPMETSSQPYDFHLTPSDTFVEQLRRRIPAILFSSIIDSNRSDHDCTVCLTRFEPDEEINQLSCGHFFHKVCLEKWLDYWNITCPLCRTPLLPEEHEDDGAASCLLWQEN